MDMSAVAQIEDGSIIIRVSLENLPGIVEGGWAAGYRDTRWKLTDTEAFARDLVHELNREEEDGTTPIHRLFDKAIDDAVDQGADGIEEHEDQDA